MLVKRLLPRNDAVRILGHEVHSDFVAQIERPELIRFELVPSPPPPDSELRQTVVSLPARAAA